MAHTSLSILKKALLATGALTLLSVAAPMAYAAPGDHSASKHRHSNAQTSRQSNRRANTRSNRRDNARNHRSNRRDNYRRRNTHYNSRSNVRRNNNRAVYRNVRHNTRHSAPYRSKIGISFNFGTPGYSRHRWAPHAYSFYRPAYGNYRSYLNRTSCRRVTLEGWRHGHRELVSVKQCSNPWDGTYIVQGSERLINTHW